MNTSTLVLLFWGERGDRKFESRNRKNKRSPFVDYSDESDEEDERAKRTRGGATRSGCAPTKGAPRSAAAPDEAAWVNPSLADATGLEDVNTSRLVEFMLSDCDWYLTNGEQKVQLLRNEGEKKNQDAVWTWFGDGSSEYCYRSTPDIKDVPGFRVPADTSALTGEGWQLMHEVKADPADSVLAEKVRAGKTWVNYGLLQLADLEALMQGSSDLGSLMSRNKGTNHTFCDKGIYKLYVGPKEVLTTSARWTHNYATSKMLGTITMHTGKEKSDAIVCSDEDGSFSTITVTASRAAYKGEPGGVVFDPKTSAVRPLLHGSAVAITFDLGFSIEKSRIVRASDECTVCYDASPCKIPAGLPPLAPCGHQDVCEPCLLKLQKNRMGRFNCPSCREEYGGPTFQLITGIAAKKNYAQDQVDRARTQMKMAEEDLRQAEIKKVALDQVSAADILQIMAVFSVSQKMAEEALNTNNHDLQQATEWVAMKQDEKAKSEAKLRQCLEEEAPQVNTTSADRFVSPDDLWDITFEVKQYKNKEDKVGSVLAWNSRDRTSVTYLCPVDGSHVKGTITNNLETKHLWFQPVYRNVDGDEEPEKEFDLKTSESCDLPYPIAKDKDEKPDAWLLKNRAGRTILTLIFTVC
jgi:NACalpha-BTF3-like transcription factor